MALCHDGRVAAYSFVLLVVPFLIIFWASLLPFYIQPSLERRPAIHAEELHYGNPFPKITESVKNSVFSVSERDAGDGTDLVRLLDSRADQNERPLAARSPHNSFRCFSPESSWGSRSCGFICSCRFRSTARLWILLVAFVTRYIPYGIRYTHSGLLQLHRNWKKPLTRPARHGPTHAADYFAADDAVVSRRLGIYLSFSAKELSMSVLLVSPQTPVVSVAIFELWENAQVGELAAFGVIWTAILVSVAIGII